LHPRTLLGLGVGTTVADALLHLIPLEVPRQASFDLCLVLIFAAEQYLADESLVAVMFVVINDYEPTRHLLPEPLGRLAPVRLARLWCIDTRIRQSPRLGFTGSTRRGSISLQVSTSGLAATV